MHPNIHTSSRNTNPGSVTALSQLMYPANTKTRTPAKTSNAMETDKSRAQAGDLVRNAGILTPL